MDSPGRRGFYWASVRRFDRRGRLSFDRSVGRAGFESETNGALVAWCAGACVARDDATRPAGIFRDG
jgi:hypothetical protein